MELKEYDLPYESFIGGWIMPEDLMDDIIEFYNNHEEEVHPGTITYPELIKDSPVDLEVKVSFDYKVEAWFDEYPFNRYRSLLQQCLNHYTGEKYSFVSILQHYNVWENYNIQHYPKSGGFKVLHCENNGSIDSLHRCLVFMTYLNDVENGGTEFPYQKLTTPAKKGLTLIWPAYWTHPHKGVVSHDQEKYIVTGWFNFTNAYKSIYGIDDD